MTNIDAQISHAIIRVKLTFNDQCNFRRNHAILPGITIHLLALSLPVVIGELFDSKEFWLAVYWYGNLQTLNCCNDITRWNVHLT